VSPIVYYTWPMVPARWRHQSKLSLRELAARLGITRMTLSRYEKGEREVPNSVVLAYARESDGQVTGEDLDRVRKRYVRAQCDETAAA
jgi:transcriptional regulator with XRE-family HTH domain